MSLAALRFIAGTLPVITQVAGCLLPQIVSSAVSIYNVQNPEEVSEPESTTTPSSTRSTTSTDRTQNVKRAPITPDSKFRGKNSIQVVTEILDGIGIKYENESEDFKSNVLNKFGVMIRVAQQQKPVQVLTDDVITSRVGNYAKALKFHQFESDVAHGNEEASYHCEEDDSKLGSQYVEYFDSSGDYNADEYEMFFEELKDEYIRQGLNKKDAVKKASEVVTRYKQNNYSKDNIPDDDSMETELFTMILVKIGYYDKDGNGMLSGSEAKDYFKSLRNGEGNITSKRYIEVEEKIFE